MSKLFKNYTRDRSKITLISKTKNGYQGDIQKINGISVSVEWDENGISNLTQNSNLVWFEADYPSELHQKMVVEILESFEKYFLDNINQMWIDLGSTMYDLHIELHLSIAAETVDFYFILKDDLLVENFLFKGFYLDKVLKQNCLNSLKNIINNK